VRKPPRRRSEPERPARAPAPSWLGDLAIMLGTFAVVSAIAGLLGAKNLGTALAFGQIGFALAVVYVIARR
jgi:hypothetical protein